MAALIVVRLLAPLSVVVCLAIDDFITALVMLLVCLGTTVCWRMRTTPGFEVVFNVTLLVAAWSSKLNLYESWPGWDLVIHFAATAVLAMLARMVVQPHWFPKASRQGEAWVTIGAAAVLCVLWELLEIGGFLSVDSAIEVHPLDTLGDIAAGMLGATFVAVLHARGVTRIHRRHEGGGEVEASADR